LRLVVDSPLAATAAHHGRIDADPAVAGACPVGNARPADAIFHAHVQGVTTAVVVEMVAGVGKEALPRILEPGGDLLRLGVGRNPVLERVVDAVLRAVGSRGNLGVPHAHGLVDAADEERTGNALV